MDPDDLDKLWAESEMAVQLPPAAPAGPVPPAALVPLPAPPVPPAAPRKTASEQLRALLTITGAPKKLDTVESVRRRVERPGNGIAVRTARLLEGILDELNDRHNLRQHPLTLRSVLLHLSEGRELLSAAQTARRHAIIAEAGTLLARTAGRANQADVLGVLAGKHGAGQLAPAEIAALTGKSAAYVRRCRAAHSAGRLGSFFTLQRTPNPRERSTYPDLEVMATVRWMGERNPARSGDSKVICWMMQDKEDFYYDHYRSLAGQVGCSLVCAVDLSCASTLMSRSRCRLRFASWRCCSRATTLSSAPRQRHS